MIYHGLKKKLVKLNFFLIYQWPYFNSLLCHIICTPAHQISKESIDICRMQAKYSHLQNAKTAILNFRFQPKFIHMILHVLIYTLAVFSPNIKTTDLISYFVATVGSNRQNYHFFSSKMSPWRPSWMIGFHKIASQSSSCIFQPLRQTSKESVNICNL